LLLRREVRKLHSNAWVDVPRLRFTPEFNKNPQEWDFDLSLSRKRQELLLDYLSV